MTRGYLLTDETVRTLIDRLVPGEIPADAIMNIDYHPDTGTLGVFFALIVDPTDDRDTGELRRTGEGAPIPTYILGPDGRQS